MPDPGKTMTPIGITSSIRSLRLNGAALLCRAHSVAVDPRTGLIYVPIRNLGGHPALKIMALSRP